MNATLRALKPDQAADRLKRGQAVLVDIREPDEFKRRHAKGALSRPLSAFEAAHLKIEAGRDVIFTCKSGMRTGANCERLAQSVEGEAFILDGGLDAWSAAGLAVHEDSKAPIEIMRQVQIAAGLLVLLGAILGLTVSSAFFGIVLLVGAGLVFAGATGFCGMARLLARMPWNRSAGG